MDIQADMLGQIRDLQIEQAAMKARQDFAFERLTEIISHFEEADKRQTENSAKCHSLLQEIQATQAAYNKMISRVLPFVIVVFTAGVSIVTSWVMSHLG